MPEIIEVELYRRAAERCVGRRVASVDAPDAWYLKRGLTASALRAAVDGGSVAAVGRKGKLLLLHLQSDEPRRETLGLRFGMTGRLVVDGIVAIDELEYGSSRFDPSWVRLRVTFEGGGELAMLDPRRLGGVELAPDLDRLGPDAFTLTDGELERALGSADIAVKVRLMDQARLAGLGNLLVDETLWRAGIDPAGAAGALSRRRRAVLAATVREVLLELTERGGSHQGDLQDERHRGGRCPRDGAELQRRTIGGRTTYSCPKHQW